MKFGVKLRFKDEKNAKNLIQAFFQEFNDESSIIIKGKEAKVEIVFDNNPPMEIIKVIEECDVIEFIYGKDLVECVKNQSKQELLEEKTKKINIENVKVPELEKIAKKAIDFEAFVKLVIDWIELEQNQDLLENLIISATMVNKISWKTLTKDLKNKDIVFKQWEKIYISKKVSEKFFDYSITILPFLNIMKQYKDYSFISEQEADIAKREETKSFT